VVTLGERYARADGFNPLRPIARSLARLAPAAFVVLAGTALAALWVLPLTRWREIAEHLLSSSIFTENLHLVDEATEYAVNTATASPMQQFWSLSIQVQVVLAAPVLVAAVGLLLRSAGWGRHGRRVAIALVAAATTGSFAWAVVAVRADQQSAYFSTLPRLWEIGAGALAALLILDRRPRRAAAAVMGWVGVAGLVACGAVLDGARTFPGWQAWWPVVCAVLVLAATDAGGASGAHRMLSLPPLQWLGLRSYGVYLWHWPILVLYLLLTGEARPTVLAGSALVLLAVLLAALTYRLVEIPAGGLLRSRRPAWTIFLVVTCAVPLIAGGTATTSHLDRQLAQYVPAPDDPDYPGVRALPDLGAATGEVELIPPLSVIREDWADLAEARCTTETEVLDPVPAKTSICTRGADSASRRIVIVGDSHVAHWLVPLGEIVDAHDWQLVALMNPGCNLSTGSEHWREGTKLHAECAAWRSRIVDRIAVLDPDLVVTLGTHIPLGQRELIPTGFVEAWSQLSARGIPVLGMRDSPRPTVDVPDCLAELGDGSAECGLDPSRVYVDEVLDAVLPPGVRLLDTRPYFCTTTDCSAVIGNVRVYKDSSHVTSTYLHTVRPLLERDLLVLTGW
jgi:peptidoglycan/LPS O-acetylase OafA/YrhL